MQQFKVMSWLSPNVFTVTGKNWKWEEQKKELTVMCLHKTAEAVTTHMSITEVLCIVKKIIQKVEY